MAWHKLLSCRPANPDVLANWYVGARTTTALCQVVLLYPSSFLEWRKELGRKGLQDISSLMPYLKHGYLQNFRAVQAFCKVSGFSALTLYMSAYIPQIFYCLPWGLFRVPRLYIPILHSLFRTVEQFSTFIPHKKNLITFSRGGKNLEMGAQVSIQTARSALELSKLLGHTQCPNGKNNFSQFWHLQD